MKYYFLALLCIPMFLMSQTTAETIEQLFEKKQYSKAETILKTELDTSPNDRILIELMGDSYGYQEKWDDAIEYYEQLVEIDDNNANYHYKYGGAMGMKALKVNKFRALGLIGDIKRSFKRAAELDPNHIDARWALVELYMQLPGIVGGSKRTSMKYANELENLSKVDGYLAKGYIYEYDDEPELAEQFYKKAIEVGGSLTCYEKLTNLYEKQEQPLKAIENIEKSHKKHQRNAMHYQIGKVAADYNLQLEKGEKCLYLYIANYTTKDGVPVSWAYYRLAQIFKHKGDKQKALEWINKALATQELKPFKKQKEVILGM
ncbi:tetratricopeptide repeat protein [Kordia sp. YSTF-M3]|uniref:Tetratricopeptide repeat protein n=1 Tax=Kordia aestuariivivens TaxID=2759037 RepID=A0ABR7QB02_9FLAO|nr:tetratricopeptide repeat protein [Kordia aestuariivivens]MBC8755757.1 tetratricopeptide repeat protein [Kordia aestuariivivens]